MRHALSTKDAMNFFFDQITCKVENTLFLVIACGEAGARPKDLKSVLTTETVLELT